jgi:CRISPR-associated protein Cmr3
MSVTTLQLTGGDPIIARDGRPFGVGQGNRMRGMGWPLPSVVAGSFRTALVKDNPSLNFSGDMPRRLMTIAVAGAFPTVVRDKKPELYLPAPADCLWDGRTRKVHRVRPIPLEQGEGVDFPLNGLDPVRLTCDQAQEDFKAEPIPAWWPLSKYEEWLTTTQNEFAPEWFDTTFLCAPKVEIRDHVCLDAQRGAAAQGLIFATAGLNVTHLPKFGVRVDDETLPFDERFAEITLSAQVTTDEKAFEHVEKLNTWHPLGGERRLVHWRRTDPADFWNCSGHVGAAIGGAERIRMVLATPAIFDHGWRPNWLAADTLRGKPIVDGPELKLVGVSVGRWRAVSGWSLAPPRGPKAIRRMVPAGSVYFFEKVNGDKTALATRGWLKPVSDARQDRNDGFGLAFWGAW